VKIISLVSGKGGVGKTASAINISAGLAKKGFKVLVIDIDKQYNLTKILNRYKPLQKSIYNVFIDKLPPSEAIQSTDIDNLDILPSSYDLEDVPERILLDMNRSREGRLKEILNLDYDFVIIDCPPDLGTITINALVISDYVLVPIKIDLGGIEGFDKISKRMNMVREEYNSKLQLLGCFITDYFENTVINMEVKKNIEKELKDKCFKTYIRHGIAYVESTFNATPVVLDESLNVGIDYMNLVEEVLQNVK
jgi:chromosome partitioning protein